VIHVRASAIVRRRPEIVWDFLTDVSALPAWVEGVMEASVDGQVEGGVGMRIDIARRAAGRRYDATCEVTAWREPSLLALETRLPGLLLLDNATLEVVPEGTLLVLTGEVIAPNNPLAALLSPPRGLLGRGDRAPAAQGVYERSLTALIKRIESLSAAPYR
jgi:uncharacterized protein YndB with AHSA1/START domain